MFNATTRTCIINSEKISEHVTAMGKPRISSIKQDHRIAVYRIIQLNSSDVVSYYNRAIVNNEMLHSTGYAKVIKRNNCTVMVTDGNLYIIQAFIVFNKEKTYALQLEFCIGLLKGHISVT